MAELKYTPRRTTTEDPHPKHEAWAAFAASERSCACDDLAALPDHDLAAVASCGDGAVRHLALAVWRARSRRVAEVG